MAAPGVTIREQDKSTRVPSFPGVYGGIVIPAKKGPVNEPLLMTSDKQLLQYFTPEDKIEVGYDVSYFSALAYLTKSSSLWVVRAAKNALYGGSFLRQFGATKANASIEFGLTDPLTGYEMDTNNGRTLCPNSEFAADNVTEIVTVSASFYLLCETGDVCQVSNAGGALPDPLLIETDYFLIKTVTDNEVKLAASLQDAIAGTAINLTDDGTGTQTIINNEVTSETGAEVKSLLIYGCNPGDWNDDILIKLHPYRTSEEFTCPAGNQLTLTQNWETGEAVRLSSTGDLPTTLSATTIYYLIKTVDSGVYEIATTYANAIVPTNLEFLDDGTGTYTVQLADEKCKEAGCFLIEVYKAGSTATPVESFTCSRDTSKLDGFNQNIYVENILEGSMYIRALDNTSVANTVIPQAQLAHLALGEGDDGDVVGGAAMITAADTLSNPDDIMLTVLMDGGWATSAYQAHLISIAEARKDCVAILSSRGADEISSNYLNDIVDYRKSVLNANSSYAAMYSPHLKILDKYNDRYIYVPPDGYAAAALSYTASNYEIWYPVGGNERGVLSVLDVRRRFTSTREGGAEIGYLYDNGINPIKFQPGKGIRIWGQKTLLSRPSALDRLNVRCLLIVIEPAIAEALESYLFKINDNASRMLVKSMINSYMENIQSRRGVFSQDGKPFMVVCDATNNTPADEDNYRMNVDLFIKPAKAIEYIPFTTIITRAGMEFSMAT